MIREQANQLHAHRVVVGVGVDHMSWLWKSLHDLFETDDGSLPDVCIRPNDPVAIIDIYALVRGRATHVVTENPYYWLVKDSCECSIDSVDNPATLVLSYEAEPFHIVFGGITVAGTKIPDLGVFVFQEDIVLDYRMGSAWGPTQLEAFFHLLSEIADLSPPTRITIEECFGADAGRRFEEALSRFRSDRPG